MVRISNAGEKWSNCSPGRLIIERTMAALHRDGVREFDFSVGNYAYKRRFGVTRLPLLDISAALSWRGWPFALRDRARGYAATIRSSMQGCDACSVSRCHTKRIDGLWLEFHGGANLSHMLGLWGRSRCVRESS